jgi:hypothetical protein
VIAHLPGQPASAVTNRHARLRGTAGRQPSGSCSWDDVGRRFRLWSRRSGRRRRGSRRAATGVRNDRGARPETVEDHDRRSSHRRPLTWCFSRLFSGPQHQAVPCAKAWYRSRTEEARVQIPSPPPPTLQVRASPASSRRRSLHAGAALGPQTPMEGCSTSARERLPKLVDRHGNPSPINNSVLQKAGWAPVVHDLPGGPCPLVVVVLAVGCCRAGRAGQPAQQPACLSQLLCRRTPLLRHRP